MLRVRTILYPTDLSPAAEAAYPYAALLAERFGAEIHALHVRPPGAPAGTADVDLLPLSTADLAADLALPAGPTRPPVTQVHLAAADAADAIVAYAREHDVDLVVMGARGRSGRHLPLLGGVAERVLHEAPCPVLTAREPLGPRGIRRILAPTDLSVNARLALPYAAALADAFGAEVDLLHVVDEEALPGADVPPLGFFRVPADDVVRQARMALEGLAAVDLHPRVPASVHVLVGQPAADVAGYAARTGADLVVLATHGLTGLRRLLMGSVAERVVRAAACPVFVVRSFGRSLLAENVAGVSARGPRALPREEWRPYFDRFSRTMRDEGRADHAEIRVFSREIGAQPETSWLPLLGLTFDPKADLLEVQVKGLDHLVAHPTTIYVDEAGDGGGRRLDRMEVIRDDGTLEVIEIR